MILVALIIVLVLTLGLLGLVVLARKRGLLGGNTEESRAMGFWIGIGVAVGAGLGAVFGLIVFDNPGIFPVFIGAGGAVGVALGSAFGRKGA